MLGIVLPDTAGSKLALVALGSEWAAMYGDGRDAVTVLRIGHDGVHTMTTLTGVDPSSADLAADRGAEVSLQACVLAGGLYEGRSAGSLARAVPPALGETGREWQAQSPASTSLDKVAAVVKSADQFRGEPGGWPARTNAGFRGTRRSRALAGPISGGDKGIEP